MRVHEAGRPFFDRSGDRLRDWMGITAEAFYDQSLLASVPMGFCFPGYDAKGSDLPPPKICAATWHERVMAHLGAVELTLLIGGYAQAWHMGGRMSVTERVGRWRETAPRLFPLPHPSWRNTGWLRKNPWFETELLPELRAAVRHVMEQQP